MRLAVLLLALTPLPLLPGCIGGCGAAHQLHVDGPVALSLSRTEVGCELTGERTTFGFQVADPQTFALVPDDAGVAVVQAEAESQDYAADGVVTLTDGTGQIDLTLDFAADGTITGDATRAVGASCTIVYAVTGTFTPVYQ